MTNEMQQVLTKLDFIKSELEFIRKHMVDVDVVLTSEEGLELDESLQDLEEGKTFTLEDIKKDRKDA